MDAIIKISSSEFNEELFKKISDLLKDRNADITISVHDKTVDESSEQYFDKLKKSIFDIESGKGIAFTMDELQDFIKK